MAVNLKTLEVEIQEQRKVITEKQDEKKEKGVVRALGVLPAKEKIEVKNNEVKEAKEQKVELEFPYDDLDLMYRYVLKELGIKNPF